MPRRYFYLLQFISASNEPGGCARTSIWRLPHLTRCAQSSRTRCSALYRMSFCDIEREGIGSLHFLTCGDGNILIGNKILDVCACLDHRILH